MAKKQEVITTLSILKFSVELVSSFTAYFISATTQKHRKDTE